MERYEANSVENQADPVENQANPVENQANPVENQNDTVVVERRGPNSSFDSAIGVSSFEDEDLSEANDES